eukprot:gene24793-20674_t
MAADRFRRRRVAPHYGGGAARVAAAPARPAAAGRRPGSDAEERQLALGHARDRQRLLAGQLQTKALMIADQRDEISSLRAHCDALTRALASSRDEEAGMLGDALQRQQQHHADRLQGEGESKPPRQPAVSRATQDDMKQDDMKQDDMKQDDMKQDDMKQDDMKRHCSSREAAFR